MAAHHWPSYPRIRSEHLSPNARLFAMREDMIAGLPVPQHPKVAEIGVWQGGFSKVILTALAPRSFFAFDIFTGHLETEWNGMTGQQLFEGLTHKQYYQREMAQFGNVVNVVEGPSEVTLKDFSDQSFDLVYVDAAHQYEFVKVDTELAAKMVSPQGVLVFNDYIMLDSDHGNPYGVVPVVNDLIVNQGWRVIGFALHHSMFCDIAVCR